MNSKLHLLICITALSVLPLTAGDTEPKIQSVQERLRETDLNLAIRQYERLSMEAFETRLKLDLLETDTDLTDAVKRERIVLLTARSEFLAHRAAELRKEALEIGGQVSVAKLK